MKYKVTPSRLDGLDAYGRQDTHNPFHYNGNSPSFFTPIYCETYDDARITVVRIRNMDKPGVWVAYIDELPQEGS